MDRVKMVNSSPSASYDSDDDNVNKKSNEKDHRDEDLKASPFTSERNKDSCTLKQGEEIESTKAELGEAMDENQRLKECVDQIMKDYEALKRKFSEISELQSKEQMDDNKMEKHDNDLVSLSLGRTSSQDFNKKNSMNNKLSANIITSNEKQNGLQEDRSLALALDGKVEASKPINFADKKQGLVRNSSLSSNANANANGNRNGNGDDERALQPHIKKPRVSVRARCDTPTMNDGCQWRKYGQKIAKGNPCPRAYYRCTVAPSCPVRKQVQRCVEDLSILITTYEGAHNHPLPLSAAAMASTTSAATYMSMSESSTSSNQGLPCYQPTTPTTAAPFEEYPHGNLMKSNIPTKPYSFYHAPNHPTITLDITNQENKIPLNNHDSKQSFAQSISQSIDNSKNTILPSWTHGLHNYGEQPYMNGVHQVRPLNTVSPKHSASHQNQTLNFETLFQNCSNNIVTDSNQVLVPDTITQAAKVLTSDPSFQSFLTAALSCFIGGKS